MLDDTNTLPATATADAAESDQTGEMLGDMSAADFRRYGHELIDWLADFLEQDKPVLPDVKPGDVRAKLPNAPPASGEPMDKIIDDVRNIIAPALTHWNHPSFFAYFSISASAPGIFGELLAAAFNVNQMLWRTAPAATELEAVAVDWLRQMLKLPETFDGIIYDTASVSTMHAIAAARESLELETREQGMAGRDIALPLLRVYASEQAHSSVEKALIALGLGQRCLCKISTDADYRMDADELRRAMKDDRRAGQIPCCVVATLGTTSTTSIDPVKRIAAICADENVWLHVDAAYAGSAAIVPELQPLFDGWQLADSIVTNPHKWLFTPIDCSVLYCRRMNVLRQAFALVPEYLRTTEDANAEARNGMDYGIQLGRRFRSLKLWMVMRYFGQDGLAARIREHCRLARKFAKWLDDSVEWETLAPVPFSTVCFRAKLKHEQPTDESDHGTRGTELDNAVQIDLLNERILEAVNRTGEVFLSHTRLRENRYALRLAIGNIRTEEAHVRRAWQLLNEARAEVLAAS